GRDDRHLGFELDLHQTADDGLRDEFVAIQTAVNYQSGADHGGIAAALGEHLGMQRNFESTGDFEKVDRVLAVAALAHFLDESDAALIDDLLVPARLDEGDTTRGFRFDIDSLLHDG